MTYSNYNFPQYQQFPRTYQQPNLRMFAVSNILEANSTPVNDLEPVFFFNRAENVIYKKQIDNTGAAPIQVFKLEATSTQNNDNKNSNNINPYEDNFKAINNELVCLSSKIDKLLEPKEENIEVEEKKRR